MLTWGHADRFEGCNWNDSEPGIDTTLFTRRHSSEMQVTFNSGVIRSATTVSITMPIISYLSTAQHCAR